jgi:hypothetical protein
VPSAYLTGVPQFNNSQGAMFAANSESAARMSRPQ